MTFPTLAANHVGIHQGSPEYTHVHEAVEEVLCLANGGTGNVLDRLISPGDTVLLKPNLIRESHAQKPDEWQQVITHGAVIEAVLIQVLQRLRGKGKVIIADGPQTDSDFDEICRRLGLHQMVSKYSKSGVEVQLLDLRRDRWYQRDDVIYKREKLPGDPAGYTRVNLAQASTFNDYALNGQLYGADYDMEETRRFHSEGKHEYILCRTPLDADVVINLPKMKTHKKTGVTFSLKNLVGINGYRNCLPHHTVGMPDEGGDEFRNGSVSNKVQSQAVVAFKRFLVNGGGTGNGVARMMKRVGKIVFGDTNEVVRSGNWHGNDTAWRMVLDLNKALFYYNGEGKLRTKPLRYLALVDGIIAGEGNGPMAPDAKPAGLLVAGLNPLAVDTVCAQLMGFDYRRIPLLARGWNMRELPLVSFAADEISCVSNISSWQGSFTEVQHAQHLSFEAHFGWKNHIECEHGCLAEVA